MRTVGDDFAEFVFTLANTGQVSVEELCELTAAEAGVTAAASAPVLHFRLNGTEFTTRAQLPPTPVVEVMIEVLSEGGSGARVFAESRAWLESIVVPEQAEAMREALREVGTVTLCAVVCWILNELLAAGISFGVSHA